MSKTTADTSRAARTSELRWGVLGAAAGVVAGSLFAGSVSALATYFARQVVTPAKARPEDLEILAVVRNGPRSEVILPANRDTTVPGTYGIVFNGGAGHARVGAITSYAPSEGTVQREIEEVYFGNLAEATRGWWSASPYPFPHTVGFADEEVHIPVAGGTAPAWLIPAEQPGSTWAVMVHGRGALRTEGLRAVRTARAAGLTSLLVSYRNDGLAPGAPDGRYGLGMTEWEDVDAAIAYALAEGAEDVVLFGWSMGGAICLQTADLSRHAGSIRGLVLDGPVINWLDVLEHQARMNRIPAAVGRLGQWLMSNKAGRRATGLAAPVDLKRLNWVDRADQLRIPTLILHSEDDDFVPIGPSAVLAEKNPQLVTFERFTQARHTKEWNADPERWERTVNEWLTRLMSAPRPGHRAGPSRLAGAAPGN